MSKEKNISKNDTKRHAAKMHNSKSNNNSTTSVGAYIGLFISLALIVVYIGYSLFVQFGIIEGKKEVNPNLATADALEQTLDQYIMYMGENGDPIGLYYDKYLKKQEEAAKAEEESNKAEAESSESDVESTESAESEKAEETLDNEAESNSDSDVTVEEISEVEPVE